MVRKSSGKEEGQRDWNEAEKITVRYLLARLFTLFLAIEAEVEKLHGHGMESMASLVRWFTENTDFVFVEQYARFKDQN